MIALLISSIIPCYAQDSISRIDPTLKDQIVNQIRLNQFRSPAPPLSYLEVAGIFSTEGGFELIDRNQIRSANNHGGDVFTIYTIELGYSGNRIAKLNGIQLNQIEYEFVDLNNDSIIDGFIYGWDASGKTGGDFTYRATSSNSPWNTMSDSLIIE